MAKEQDDERLILLLPEEVMNQPDRVFDRLAEDDELRARFEDDPVGVLKELGIDLPEDTSISLINRVIFHLMGSEKFIKWMQEYNESLREKHGAVIELDSEVGRTIREEVNTAIAEHLPEKIKAEFVKAFPAAGPDAYSSRSVVAPPLDVWIPPPDIVIPPPDIVTPLPPIPGPVFQFRSEFEVEITFFFIVGVAVALGLSYQVFVSGVGGKAWGGPDG